MDNILNLMQDIHCFDELSKWTSRINVFDVLGTTRTEIRHSYMLQWLLDPNENHGLGSDFLYDFIVCVSKLTCVDKQFSVELLSSNLYEVEVKREWNNIDLMLVFDSAKKIIVIENKIGAKEHKAGKTDKSQLTVYSEQLKKHYSTFKFEKLFLTPFGDDPSDNNKDWHVFTYDDILEVLEQAYEYKKNQLTPESSILISNYIDTIKKHIIVDDELVKTCNGIYEKHGAALESIRKDNNDLYHRHKEAIDLIFEYREDPRTKLGEVISNYLKEKSIKVSLRGTRIRFWTDWLLKEFQQNNVYYQFELSEVNVQKVQLRVTLIFINTEDNNILAKMKKVKQELNFEGKKFKVGWHSKDRLIIDSDKIGNMDIDNWIDYRLKEIEDTQKKWK